MYTPFLHFCWFPAEQSEGKWKGAELKYCILFCPICRYSGTLWETCSFLKEKGNSTKGEERWEKGAERLRGGELLLGCILWEKDVFNLKIYHSRKNTATVQAPSNYTMSMEFIRDPFDFWHLSLERHNLIEINCFLFLNLFKAQIHFYKNSPLVTSAKPRYWWLISYILFPFVQPLAK